MNSPSSETWEVIALAPSGSYGYARSWAINDSNVVVGTANTGPNGPANFAWRWRNSAFGVLPLPAGASARSINRSGAIVGAVGALDSQYGCLGSSAFHLSPAGVMSWLPMDTVHALGRDYPVWNVANDINDSGLIAGTDCFMNQHTAIQWSPTGNNWQLQYLRYLPAGGAYGAAFAVNNKGFVVGHHGSTDIGAHYWLYPSHHAALDTPGLQSMARDINNNGYTVGVNQKGDQGAYLWLHPFSATPLGFTDAWAISDKLRAAGHDEQHPVTARNGLVTALPLPQGATKGLATAVNSCGIVAGHVTYPASPTQGTREQPVIWRRKVGGVATCD